MRVPGADSFAYLFLLFILLEVHNLLRRELDVSPLVQTGRVGNAHDYGTAQQHLVQIGRVSYANQYGTVQQQQLCFLRRITGHLCLFIYPHNY